MCVCMHVCMYACIHVCMYVCIHVCACTHVCMHVCMYVCMYTCVYVCMYADVMFGLLIIESKCTMHTRTIYIQVIEVGKLEQGEDLLACFELMSSRWVPLL